MTHPPPALRGMFDEHRLVVLGTIYRPRNIAPRRTTAFALGRSRRSRLSGNEFRPEIPDAAGRNEAAVPDLQGRPEPPMAENWLLGPSAFATVRVQGRSGGDLDERKLGA